MSDAISKTFTGAAVSLALLDALPDAALLTDTTGRIRYMNVSAARLLGVSAAEAHGRPVQDVLALLDGITRQPIHEPFAYLLSGSDIGPTGRHDLLERRGAAPVPFEYSIGSIRASDHGPPGFVLLLRDATRMHARIQQLIELARRDEHTQLLRRGEFARRLARALESLDGGSGHVLLFMDLDRFKAINDHAGHAGGDMALREVATRLRARVREQDTLARLGGDEFGLLLERCPLPHARERARELQAAIAERPFDVGKRHFRLDVSIGLAAIQSGRHEVRAVMSAADAACYRAKRMGGQGPRISEVVLG
jgi:diguanylate cyclase (GGDEF)-like protein/PAS domain S-box-containing protein